MNSSLVYPLVFLFVLGVVILVHEFGHYAVAKLFKIRVEVFSFGFGPRLFGFRRGDTDYRVSAFPLGGYVKLTGETPDEETSGSPDEFLSRPRFQRFLVLVMGATLNMILAIGLWWGVYQVGIEEPEFYRDVAVVGGVKEDSPAARAGVLPGDRIVAIDGSPVGSWKDLNLEVSLSPGQRRMLEIERNGQRLSLEIGLLSHTPYRIGYAGLVPAAGVVVRELLPGKPAAEADVRPGDQILSVGGETVYNRLDVIEKVSERGGERVLLGLLRDGREIERDVAVEETDEGGRIGVSLAVPSRLRRYPPLEAFSKSLQEARENSGLLFLTIRKLLRRELSLRTMSGPIDIYKFVGIAWERGFSEFFSFMALISLQLGIINLLPIPVLDGGHILVLAIEGILRKDLSLRIKERVMQMGFVFLVLLMGSVIYFDIVKHFAQP